MDKLADHPNCEWPEWPLISQFGSTGWRCLLVSWTSILSTCERARASKIRGRKRVRNVCSNRDRGGEGSLATNWIQPWKGCYLPSRDDRYLAPCETTFPRFILDDIYFNGEKLLFSSLVITFVSRNHVYTQAVLFASFFATKTIFAHSTRRYSSSLQIGVQETKKHSKYT